MEPAQFVMIQHYGAKDPRKQHALQVMEVKAHAARLSHIKRRKKQHRLYCPNCHALTLAKLPDQLAWSRVLSFADRSSENEDDIPVLCVCPQSPLGQGKVDPFSSGQSDELPALMRKGLDYVIEVLWPMNSPALQGALLKSTIMAWRTAGVQSDLEYHAQISNAASLCLASSTDPAIQRPLALIRLRHQNKAIQLIQGAINSLTQPPSAALIACIMNVSTSGLQDLIPPREQPIPTSPVSKGFNFALYARFKPTEEHYRAAAELVRQRGGLETLPPGLAHPLQLEDVHRANRCIGLPKFSLLAYLAERGDNPAYAFETSASQLLSNLGSGFHFCDDHDPDRRLRELVLQARNFTAAIDQYERNDPLRCPLSELATQSIIILHRLLTLPKLGSDAFEEPMTEEEHRYEIARLSTLIYANLVIFPSGSRDQPRHGLAELLHEQLCLYHQQSHDQGSTQASESSTIDSLVLWAVVLGGIASSGIAIRSWFAARLGMYMTNQRLVWGELDRTLHTLLYWDYVMAGPTEDLWNEAVETRHPK
ncbi:hypothetical protein PV04_05697 [Phialophora macrospora]|uniref:Transcription factor domain-containing protein n=1 Tax=Phialophora macrospora TaxID=1851006 RepID=A0A0D2CMA9_9EURO|nr:hypothetical protein PV04_05697 [Phialophora macrospora]